MQGPPRRALAVIRDWRRGDGNRAPHSRSMDVGKRGVLDLIL